MQCPNCGAKLEREDHEDSSYSAGRRGHEYTVKVINAIYHCEDCDYEAIWRKGRGTKVLFPGVGARE